MRAFPQPVAIQAARCYRLDLKCNRNANLATAAAKHQSGNNRTPINVPRLSLSVASNAGLR